MADHVQKRKLGKEPADAQQLLPAQRYCIDLEQSKLRIRIIFPEYCRTQKTQNFGFGK